jgi:hypothetical protein
VATVQRGSAGNGLKLRGISCLDVAGWVEGEGFAVQCVVCGQQPSDRIVAVFDAAAPAVFQAAQFAGQVPMRTQIQAFVVKEDICVAKGQPRANPHVGTSGGTQYFIGNGDKAKLTSGPIVKFSK